MDTFRTKVAKEVMLLLIEKAHSTDAEDVPTISDIAHDAVRYADALVKELQSETKLPF